MSLASNYVPSSDELRWMHMDAEELYRELSLSDKLTSLEFVLVHKIGDLLYELDEADEQIAELYAGIEHGVNT